MSRKELLSKAMVSGAGGVTIGLLSYSISKMRNTILPFSTVLIIGIISQQAIYWGLDLLNIQITKEG